MFVNCPHCRTLVATDPATDLPPPFCPECGRPLRDADDAPPARDDVEASHAGQTPHDDGHVAGAPTQAFGEADPHRDSWWDEAEAAARTRSGGAPGAPQFPEAPTDDAQAPPSDARPGSAADGGSPEPDTATAQAQSAAALAAARVTPLRGSLPGFLHRREGRPARRDWRATAAILGLGLLLMLQVVLADRDRLAAQAGWRPLLTALCAGLGCALPPWREPGAFTLLQRDVRQHPTRPGALRVSATFRNDARWAQPWPRLRLSLADVDGRTAGVRSFTAEEYLGGAPAQAELASGETATVAMDILEPAPDIVAFDFAFR